MNNRRVGGRSSKTISPHRHDDHHHQQQRFGGTFSYLNDEIFFPNFYNISYGNFNNNANSKKRNPSNKINIYEMN
jgi:hypothetical protein